ncbi:MAG TPA: DUF58 domain-containing protein [Methanocorpusculum sp.]|jgi:uncharacterized protein (DUF58 family)|nr:DUF58 domain-containing protein [Methanocorpusculum sp.]HJJ81026.1 DUF58 domain-containing protein [Methanocorpusculum sp.]
MYPTPLSLLLLLFAVPAFVYAWLMNSGNAAAVGLGILAFLLIRGLSFLQELRSYTESLTISREADSAILTQGGNVRVTTSVSAKKTDLSVSMSDVPPTGSVLVQGSFDIKNGNTEYLLRIPVSGRSSFGGISVSAQDAFFKTTIPVPYAKSPELKVYSAGIAATFNQDGFSPIEDAKERDYFALISGTEARYYRPYAIGDNVSDINWKLSAKYDELYVQMKTDSSGANPILVFDLPEEGTPEKTVAAFADAAVGAIERLNRRDSYPVIVYSGADCLWIGTSKHKEEIFARLSLAGKIRRETALFRHRHVASLMKEASSIPEKNDFSTKIKNALSFSHKRYPTTFEQNIKNITSEATLLENSERTSLDDTSIYVVSCALGDISNLSYLIADATVQQRDVVFILGGIRDTEREKQVISALYSAGASSVEVLS